MILIQRAQAQAMKEQAQLKEEMAYQYKIGNYEVNSFFFRLIPWKRRGEWLGLFLCSTI